MLAFVIGEVENLEFCCCCIRFEFGYTVFFVGTEWCFCKLLGISLFCSILYDIFHPPCTNDINRTQNILPRM